MSEPFIGEIRNFAFSFTPHGWAKCEGQVLPISGNETLYSLIGTTYGGDGVKTLALPDYRQRHPVHHSPKLQQGFIKAINTTSHSVPSITIRLKKKI